MVSLQRLFGAFLLVVGRTSFVSAADRWLDVSQIIGKSEAATILGEPVRDPRPRSGDGADCYYSKSNYYRVGRENPCHSVSTAGGRMRSTRKRSLSSWSQRMAHGKDLRRRRHCANVDHQRRHWIGHAAVNALGRQGQRLSHDRSRRFS